MSKRTTGFRDRQPEENSEDVALLSEQQLHTQDHSTAPGIVLSFPVFIGVSVIFVALLGTVIALGTVLILSAPPATTTYDYVQFHNAFVSNVDATSIMKIMQNYSAIPHVAGTPQDKIQAENTLELWKSYGIDARIEEHPILLTYPGYRSVAIVYPPEQKFNCTLKEAVVNDGTSGSPDAPPVWNGWSAAGDVTAELVYVNYGMLEDFQLIENVNLTGKIVIVRYGRIFRGNKAKFAQDRGAAAVLIYTDPGDTHLGESYPDGPWSTNTTAQRGSVWTGNGDPLTPGWPSLADGPRLELKDAQEGSPFSFWDNLPSIPIQPLAYGDAYPLLMGLAGNTIPDPNWRGGFNLTHMGPGPVQVNVRVDVTFKITPIWNVIGTIEGATEPDRTVLIGSHRDAWSFGAIDPISGHSSIMEIGRTLGVLLQQGWKPRRTIVLCSWDAEEYGLIGSFEFTEKWQKYLTSTAVTYLNLDTAVTGGKHLFIAGTPALQKKLIDISKKIVLQKTTNTSLYSLWTPPKMNLLGSGSDYTSFIQRLGIASLNFDLDGDEGSYSAVYHSNYDSFYWVKHFADPEFFFHQAIVRLCGSMALALADEELLPFDYSDYSVLIDNSITDLKNTVGNVLNYTNIDKAAANFKSATELVAEEISAVGELSDLKLKALNDRLMLTERAFLGDSVVSGNDYYLHVISTPSSDNAYSAKVFPAIYSAYSKGDLKLTQFLVDRIAQIVDGAAEVLAFSFLKEE